MPRVAAALAVLIAVTFSIGFNISHYPAVWRMLEPPTTAMIAPRAAEPVEPATPPPEVPAIVETATAAPHAPSEPSRADAGRKPEPIPICQSETPPAPKAETEADVSKGPAGYRVECTGDSCRLVADDASPPDSPEEVVAETSSANSADKATVDQPEEAVPAEKYAAQSSSPEETPAEQTGKPLVPLGASETQNAVASEPQDSEAPSKPPQAPPVRRLPPIDQESPPPTLASPPAENQIPLYATTRTS